MSKRINLKGMKIGGLEVIKFSKYDYQKRETYWWCKCLVCGKYKEIARGTLTRKSRKPLSCGCLQGRNHMWKKDTRAKLMYPSISKLPSSC